MAKRLQVILKGPEYRYIQRMARSRRMSMAEWVRQALDLARRRKPVGGVGKKLEVLGGCSGLKYKIETGSFGERSKVPVSRQETDASVDTALGDQRVVG
jgi:hypothetical protein